jgi:hypothetical protein
MPKFTAVNGWLYEIEAVDVEEAHEKLNAWFEGDAPDGVKEIEITTWIEEEETE